MLPAHPGSTLPGSTPPLVESHSLRRTLLFQAKAAVLTARRGWHNVLARPRRFRVGHQLAGLPRLAESASDLWNPADTARNWQLTAGKVHNLRRAARRLHGLEVPAGAVFSFWAQVGNPNLGGYVPGREIREGCVVPTIAGGLCQLSNALYDAALQAGFPIVERHRHSRVVAGSLAERDRDATVKWNYIDLRFRAAVAFRLEVELTADKLRVAFRGAAPAPTLSGGAVLARPTSTLNDCFSCGNVACFKHPGRQPAGPTPATTTFVLDERWPEFEAYVQSVAQAPDHLLAPWLPLGRLPAPQPGWRLAGLPNRHPLLGAAWQRAGRRRLARPGANVFALSLRLDQQLALATARRIPWASTHVVVSQNLLPFLWEAGALGGRTFDVLMTRLPLQHLHQRLDAAHQQHAASATLHDFRAPQALIDLENQALTRARHLITPHQEIADLFAHKVLKLDWQLPPAPAVPPTPAAVGAKVLFPASALGRKGAYEVRRLAQELPLRLVLTGRATEAPGFWGSVATEWATANPLAGCALVVLPAYVEHQPRLLLRALAAGVPVVATTACGLAPADNLTLVPTGDFAALKQAVQQRLGL